MTDLRISYRKAVEAVAVHLAVHDPNAENARQAFLDAERLLRPLLTDRQRAALEKRGART
jgi:hypothetical protein